MVTPGNRKAPAKRRGKRSSSLRGKKRTRIVEDDDDIGNDIMASDMYAITGTQIRTKKSQLTAICRILDINPMILECPIDGFKSESLGDTSSRAFERASRIVRALTRGICNLVSPSNTSFKVAMMDKTSTMEGSLQKFTRNALLESLHRVLWRVHLNASLYKPS